MKKIFAVFLAVLMLCTCLCACGQAAPTDAAQDATLPSVQAETQPETKQAGTLHIVESVAKNGARKKSNTAFTDLSAEPAQDLRFEGTLGTALVFDVTEQTEEGVSITLKEGAFVFDSAAQLQNKNNVQLLLKPDETAQVALETDDATGIYDITLVND